MANRGRLIGLLCIAASAAGCVGGPEVGASVGDLTAIDPDTTPLEEVAAPSWQSAPAGCEDRLGVDVQFQLASGHHGLVAALDGEGRVLCVDTVESVQEALEADGRAAEAAELGHRFLLSLHLLGTGDFHGDPTPQPSTQMTPAEGTSGGNRNGDPSPQPS